MRMCRIRYDSHPRLADRMKNVGIYISRYRIWPIVTKEPENSWANYTKNAKTIEEKLWAGYEQNFAQEHHHSPGFIVMNQRHKVNWN